MHISLINECHGKQWKANHTILLQIKCSHSYNWFTLWLSIWQLDNQFFLKWNMLIRVWIDIFTLSEWSTVGCAQWTYDNIALTVCQIMNFTITQYLKYQVTFFSPLNVKRQRNIIHISIINILGTAIFAYKA